MKIDVFNGSVTFSSGTVGPQYNKSTFLTSPIGSVAKNVLENAGYATFHFNPEPGVSGSAIFKEERLDRMFLLMAIPSDEMGEWSVTREIERKSFHDRWLLQELGKPPYDFAWGTVASEYDVKGCESDIILVYGNRSRAVG